MPPVLVIGSRKGNSGGHVLALSEFRHWESAEKEEEEKKEKKFSLSLSPPPCLVLVQTIKFIWETRMQNFSWTVMCSYLLQWQQDKD